MKDYLALTIFSVFVLNIKGVNHKYHFQIDFTAQELCFLRFEEIQDSVQETSCLACLDRNFYPTVVYSRLLMLLYSDPGKITLDLLVLYLIHLSSWWWNMILIYVFITKNGNKHQLQFLTFCLSLHDSLLNKNCVVLYTPLNHTCELSHFKQETPSFCCPVLKYFS